MAGHSTGCAGPSATPSENNNFCIFPMRPLLIPCATLHLPPPQVRESGVAGLGVFARAAIPAGTVLGAYPGRPRAAQEMQAKIARAPGAASYCFQTRNGCPPLNNAGQGCIGVAARGGW